MEESNLEFAKEVNLQAVISEDVDGILGTEAFGENMTWNGPGVGR